MDLKALIAEEFPGMPVAVCANLPYYITSPIVMKLLGDRLPIESLTVMVQKEAADAAVLGTLLMAIRAFGFDKQHHRVRDYLPKIKSE